MAADPHAEGYDLGYTVRWLRVLATSRD